MNWHTRWMIPVLLLVLALSVIAKTETRVPKIWDDERWRTGRRHWLRSRFDRHITLRPSTYSVPADNLRTYPVYPPDKEPAGYWEALQKKKPEPLVDLSKIRTKQDWIAAGARAFRELDNPFSRSDDPVLIARARDPKTFAAVAGLADGTMFQPRWVVTDRGLMLTNLECASCHRKVNVDRTIEYGGPLAACQKASARSEWPVHSGSAHSLLSDHSAGDNTGAILRRMFDVPWDPDARLQRFFTATEAAGLFANSHGVVPRDNGSPCTGRGYPTCTCCVTAVTSTPRHSSPSRGGRRGAIRRAHHRSRSDGLRDPPHAHR